VRRLACALALALAATAAVGQTRPSSRSMTCQAARQLVASRGAVVLSTGPYAFDRYVSSSPFCVLGETTEPAWIPTADTSQCFVGHRCRETGLDLYGR
jgi:hypothetical protein